MGKNDFRRQVFQGTRFMSDIITLTSAAANRVRYLLETHGNGAEGLTLGIKTTGCSGFSYKLDFINEIADDARVVETEGVKVVVDPDAIDLVQGTAIDWVEDKFGAAFSFKNPNEASRCGCGESFSV
jgi:iron-sulfur cluster assembly protein